MEANFKIAESTEQILDWWDKSNLAHDSFIGDVYNVLSYKSSNPTDLVSDETASYEALNTFNIGRCFLYMFPKPYVGDKELLISLDLKHHLDGQVFLVYIQYAKEQRWQVAFNLLYDVPTVIIAQADHEYTIGKKSCTSVGTPRLIIPVFK